MRDQKIRVRGLLLFCLFFLFAPRLGADTLVLKSGQRIECTVKERTAQAVRIDLQGTELTYDPADVAGVEMSAPPSGPIVVPMAPVAKPSQAAVGQSKPSTGGSLDPELARPVNEFVAVTRRYGGQMKQALQSRNRQAYVQASEAYQRESQACLAKVQEVLDRRSKSKAWTADQAQAQMALVQEKMNEANQAMEGVPAGMCPVAMKKYFGG